MLKLVSLSALAAAAVVAALSPAPVSAASMPTNLGHISVSRPMNNFGSGNVITSYQVFAPNTFHGPAGPKYQKKWVCGPIVNWDGTPHCHWVDIQRTP